MTFAAFTLPDTLTLTRDEWETEPGMRCYHVTRTARGKVREIAHVTIYDDNRVYARRSMHVRSTVDYADWSAVTRAAHAANGQDDDSGDYFTGIVFAPNPVEVGA